MSDLVKRLRESEEWKLNMRNIREAADRIEELEARQQWQPIVTAPDEIHIRGLWVNVLGNPDMEWQQFIGYIHDETGDFIDPEYGNDFGWAANDYTHWMPLPEPPEKDDG